MSEGNLTQEPSIIKISSNIVHLKYNSNLPGANELNLVIGRPLKISSDVTWSKRRNPEHERNSPKKHIWICGAHTVPTEAPMQSITSKSGVSVEVRFHMG